MARCNGRCVATIAAFVWLEGIFATTGLAGAAGPSVGNPNTNEAAEDPEPRASSAPVTSRKVSAPMQSDGGMHPYGGLEAQHVINDYFNENDKRMRRDPAVHARFQLGARFYQDRLDVSASAGAVKMAGSQSFYQKRPEFAADISVMRGQYFHVLWYNLIQVPVRAADRDPTEFADSDRFERDALRGIDATVYTVGLAPLVKTEWRMTGGRYLVRAVADGFTKMYSKALYVDETNAAGGSGFGLVATDQDPVEGRFEDRALRYVHQESIAFGWSPNFAPYLSTDLGAHIESRYIPEYFRNDTGGGWDYHYVPERRSFWRARLTVDVTPSWSVHNEFFVFRNGFFAENRVNQEGRFRNIVKVALKL